ncbi:MAG TPA: hypothetical protein VGJ82_01990 [Thermoanaerobaculia bacterium]|jgi:hypothetical protein
MPNRESRLTRAETVDAVAGVAAELMFALLPLLVVAIIMVYRGESSRVFTSAEWSFGSAILCGQALVKFVSGLARARQPNWHRVAFAVAALFVFGVVPALTVLALMILSEKSPQVWLDRAQIVVFLLSMAEFFIFGTIGDLWHERQTKE